MFKLLLILPCLSTMFQPLKAKVEAPNYHFNLESLSEFYPDKSIIDLEKKFSKPELMNDEGEIKTFKYLIKHNQYQFPVLVQIKNNLILDFFTRLPNYFLHDGFLQSLVNKYGKQTSYKKIGEEAVYIWELKPNRHIYSAACTITCFPIFYAVEKTDSTQSLLQRMKKASKL